MKKLKLNQKSIKKIRRAVAIFTTALFILSTCILPAFAADAGTGFEDSLNKAENLMVTFVKFIGVGIGIFGAVQFGIAWQSHDGAGKLQGITLLGAGILIYYARDILSLIGMK